MPTKLYTFSSSTLPADFSGNGQVRLVRSFVWDRGNVVDGTPVDASNLVLLPQTSDFFVMLDDPKHDGFGNPVNAATRFDVADCAVDHPPDTLGNRFCTYGCKGAELRLKNVSIPAQTWLQFHYVFLGGETNTPFNGFAQFQLVASDGTMVKKSTFAQTMQGTQAPGRNKRYRWRAHEPMFLHQPFTGTMRWVVATGEKRPQGNTSVNRSTDTYPSGLAIDFIAIRSV